MSRLPVGTTKICSV